MRRKQRPPFTIIGISKIIQQNDELNYEIVKCTTNTTGNNIVVLTRIELNDNAKNGISQLEQIGKSGKLNGMKGMLQLHHCCLAKNDVCFSFFPFFSLFFDSFFHCFYH